MRWPVDGPIFGSKFGMRYHPTQHRWKLHEGQDFPNAPGTPLKAVADGTVTTNLGVASNPGGGNFITITLADGAQARYFHMRERSPLAVGTRVKQGQVVGYLGNTGTWTTGPHLHFEIRVNGSPVDPRAYIQARLGSTAGEIINTETNTPAGEEEDEDMAVNSGFYYKTGGKQLNVIVNFGSGAFHEYEASGDYNNGIATAFQTTDFAKITKSHRDKLEQDCAKIRQGK